MQTITQSLGRLEEDCSTQQFQNILWFYDNGAGGSPACERVVAVAKQHDAQLSVVDVLDPLPRDLRRWLT